MKMFLYSNEKQSACYFSMQHETNCNAINEHFHFMYEYSN